VIPVDGDVSIPARAYRPQVPADGPAGAVLWLHGGGWVMGDVEGFDHVCRALCNAAGHAVLSVDYRLAPEHPFPAAVQDAVAAVAWALDEGGARQLRAEPGRLVVGGDSAGGHLAAVAARHHAGALRGQLLVYPALDPARDSAAYREFRDGPLLTDASMQACWAAFLGDADPQDPDASPLRADVGGLPPAWIAVAGIDPLRDDGRRYATALGRAGVPVVLREWDTMSHGFLRWGGVVDAAGELVGWLADGARDALDDTGAPRSHRSHGLRAGG
jgi:acetyl esterase